MNSDMPRRICIAMLGPLEVSRDGVPLTVLGNRLRCILAVLARTPGSTVSVDSIIEHVWGTDLPVHPRRSAQTWIVRLRGVLGADAVRRQQGGYLLDVQPDDVDASRFAALLEQAAAEPEPAVERDILQEAVQLWRGTPFQDMPSGLLHDIDRPQLTEQYLAAIQRAADLDLEAGHPHRSLARLQGETAAHPLREPLWARLLAVQARTGRTAEALATYQTIRVRLADELGVDPSGELRRIHADLLSTDGPKPTELLRPRHLPADVDKLVGRKDVLNRLDEVLRPEDDSLERGAVVTVDGIGGSGKTSVVVHWAHLRRDAFPDGQLFVDLQGYSSDQPVDPHAALGAVLIGLGVAGDRIPAEPAARSALLRSLLADRRILVILDNARDARQVRPLLPGGPARVVVTSRRDLRGLVAKEGARRIALAELPAADSLHLIDSRLAGRVRADRADLAELAEICGHLPLALAIGAEYVARHPDVPLPRLMAEVRDERMRLDVLDSDDPEASLRSVLSWSYAALDPVDARALRLLAWRLPSAFDTGAAMAVTALDVRSTRLSLDRLVGMHMVERSEAGRFVLHDLVRAYAGERCEVEDESAERCAATRRHLNWLLYSLHNAVQAMKRVEHRAFAVYLHDAAVAAQTFDDPQAALAWCERERPALVAAVVQAHDEGLHDYAWRLAWQLGRYLLMGDFNDDLLRVSEVGLASAEQVGGRVVYLALNAHGNALGRNHHDQALRCFDAALAQCREHDDVGTESVVLMNRATSSTRAGDLTAAVAAYEDSLAAAQRWRQDGGESSLLSPNLAAISLNLGNALNCLQRYDDGIARTEEALQAAREAGNQIIVGMAHGNLGEAWEATGEYDRAHAHCRKGAELLREVGAHDGLVDVLLTHARVHAAIGDPAEVRRVVAEARDILHDVHDPRIVELTAVAESLQPCSQPVRCP